MSRAPAPWGRCMAQGTRAQAAQSFASRARSKDSETKTVSSFGRVWGSPIAIRGGGGDDGGGAGGGGGVGGGGLRPRAVARCGSRQKRARCPERR
jgi:hypothetical protein